MLSAAFAALTESGLSKALAPFSPVLAGTIPLGLEVAGSDLDICCRYASAADFNKLLAYLASFPDFSVLEKQFSSGPAHLIRLTLKEWPVEIIFQSGPVGRQTAVRHLWVEAQLIQKYGERFQEEVHAARKQGFKTEPAFAKVLALPGDPYQALLTLETEFELICVS